MNEATTRVDAKALSAFCTQVLLAHGVPPGDATLVADTLVKAELWGHPSHGVLRLSWYAARIRSGAMRALTTPKIAVDAGAVTVIDGGDGIGQVLAAMAVDRAVERAQQHGVGVVAVRNSNHFGTAMYYTRMAAERDCICFLSTNASPAMAPWGGRQKAVGTNPWSIGAPVRGQAPMVLDIANTAVARGKIYHARQVGTVIPDNWAMTASGERTTDPLEGISGILLPMAGHKGYGIALMMDVLSGVLTGSEFGAAVVGPYDPQKRSGCGHLTVALDVKVFQPLDEYFDRMDRLVAQLRSVPLASGHDAIFYPGEPEARSEHRRLADGIELPRDTAQELRELATASKVDAALLDR